MQSVSNYIGKDIDKGYEYETLNFKKSFSESQIKQIYKRNPQRLQRSFQNFGKKGQIGSNARTEKYLKNW